LGLVQTDHKLPSSWQLNVDPGSLEEKAKLALVEVVGFEGASVMAVFGSVRSTVHECVAGVASTLLAASIPRTANA
jgi:hypothetical protein